MTCRSFRRPPSAWPRVPRTSEDKSRIEELEHRLVNECTATAGLRLLLEHRQSEADVRIANARALREEAAETAAALRESLQSRDIHIARLQSELTRREAECDRLADDFADAVARSESLQEQVDEWRSEAADARRAADEWEEACGAWADQARAWLGQIGQLQATLETAQRILRVAWPAQKETPQSILEWADQTFGNPGPHLLTRKLLEEAAELDRCAHAEAGPRCVEGLAAVAITFVRLLAYARIQGIGEAIDQKMAVNRHCLWRRQPDGTWQHVEEVAS